MADNPTLSKITLPSGTTYDIKDAWSRAQIESLSGYTYYMGVTSTAISDGSTTNPVIINGESVTAKTGAICTYQSKEFIWNGTAWQEFGDLSALGDLEYADTASTTYTPQGSISATFAGDSTFAYVVVDNSSVPEPIAEQRYTPSGTITGTTFTGSSMTSTGKFTPAGNVSLTNSNKTATVSATSGTATYTPAGSITGTTFTGASMTSTGKFTPSGSVSLSNSNQTVTVSKASSGTATYTPEGSITGTTFTGASMTSTGNFTPSGSVSLTNSNVTATVSAAQSGTATYTPAGNITAGAITVKTAGSTGTIHNPTKQTVAKTVVAAAPTATAPANEITYYSVANETLSLYKLGYTTGDSITTSDVTVKTGDAVYQSANPTFSGTGVRLVTGNISVPSSASFSGTEGSVSVSGTTTGSVSNGTFTGTGARLVTGNISVPSSASFTGTEDDVSVSGTTTGSVSNGTFSGTGVRLVTGNISVPTSASFSGTEGNVSVSGTTTGSVSNGTFTGNEANLKTISFTPSGSVSASFTGTQATIQVTPDE
jgi:hypothetical protein